ncbi:MAG: hypothetical protein GWO81_07220 [Verrucomicrobia bacterium]|nr:hypothetical protein [Verrucomicrobiota bacterium]
MKNYHLAKKSLLTGLMAALMAVTFISLPSLAEAQTTSEKVRIMAEALRARDSGNLGLAKEKAEELIRLVPNDTNAQRVLASINSEMERRGSGEALFGATTLPVTASESDTGSVALAAQAESDRLAAEAAAAQEAERLAAKSRTEALLKEAKSLEAQGDYAGARARLDDYFAAGANSRTARNLDSKLEQISNSPAGIDLADVSPKFLSDSEIVADLLLVGRAQFINGDYDGASATFKEVEARAPNNAEAKLYSQRIAEVVGAIQKANLYKTREQMLAEVNQQWERPKVFDISASDAATDGGDSSTQRKLNSIVIPQVNFSGMDLTRVIETLSELSLQYDSAGEGVNIVVLFNPNNTNPSVNISLRNLSLDRILQFVTQQVNFTYEVGSDAVTVAPSFGPEGGQSTVTEFFPISAGTVIRLTGFGDGGASSGAVDPFAPVASASSGPSANEKTEALQAFFQRAGVNFELPGASLAFDGEQLIITQTRQNLDRMRAILRNYSEVKQVEIEAKLLEVAQNDLDELGFDWTVGNGAMPILDTNGAPVLDRNGNVTYSYKRKYSTQGRNLNDAFSVDRAQSEIVVNGDVVATNQAPNLSTAIDLASSATSLFTATGWNWGKYNVDLAIRALSRKTGSDLMSAPKVTVLSGKRATITVAQEFRYPESYGDIESTASTGGSNSGGSSAISITAGTPEDFVTRNVGVELAVTPNVENDDTISLVLEPKVTEFEGFVEYGGPSVAISSGTTVTVPAGFYQPIFSVRELSTEVTVFDGATLVMGGLTRDEVKSVNDKVPVLGDIPGVGRLFRSEGESRQKRNLLMFITANLVSPGGSLSRQSYPNAEANELFQNPTIMTPSGAVNRAILDEGN